MQAKPCILNNQEITGEVKKEIKNTSAQIKMKTMTQNIKDATKSSSQKEVYSNSTSPHETRKTSNKQSNLTPKATRERRKRTTIKLEGKKS